MVPTNRKSGSVASVAVSTAPPWVVRPPGLLGTPAATAVGESALKIDFTPDGVGKVNYLVVYDSVYVRFMDTYVVFDNQVGVPRCLGGSCLVPC